MSLVPIKAIKKKYPAKYTRADVLIAVTIQHIVVWDVNHTVSGESATSMFKVGRQKQKFPPKDGTYKQTKHNRILKPKNSTINSSRYLHPFY